VQGGSAVSTVLPGTPQFCHDEGQKLSPLLPMPKIRPSVPTATSFRFGLRTGKKVEIIANGAGLHSPVNNTGGNQIAFPQRSGGLARFAVGLLIWQEPNSRKTIYLDCGGDPTLRSKSLSMKIGVSWRKLP
jgi:hypothetical protein